MWAGILTEKRYQHHGQQDQRRAKQDEEWLVSIFPQGKQICG